MKFRIALAVLLSSCVFGAPQNPRKPSMEEMHRLHQDSKAYIAVLEDPKRDQYQKPHEVLMALGLKESETIADIGAGSGYFAFRFARHVGDKGHVYAVDVSPDMILHMNRRIRDLGLNNVTTVLSAPDDPLLKDASIDRFFICETWHHIQNQAGYLALMKRMLKPGGQIIMIDFHKKDLPVGPPAEMKISREDLIREMESNGFHLAKEYTFLPYQYFLVFTA
jgi:ubiquinone/menaquinone biosynthesis C-methylase UbiE